MVLKTSLNKVYKKGVFKYRNFKKNSNKLVQDLELQKAKLLAKAEQHHISLLQNVSIEKKIGAGNFGEVYLGKWQGSSVALKKLTQDQTSEFEREAAMLWF